MIRQERLCSWLLLFIYRLFWQTSAIHQIMSFVTDWDLILFQGNMQALNTSTNKFTFMAWGVSVTSLARYFHNIFYSVFCQFAWSILFSEYFRTYICMYKITYKNKFSLIIRGLYVGSIHEIIKVIFGLSIFVLYKDEHYLHSSTSQRVITFSAIASD